jgi:hypothetical protein
MMTKMLMMLSLVALAAVAAASDQSNCTAAAGTFMTGKITAGPRFATGSFLKGVELSHTHVTLKSDQDGKSYDIAMDDVYASGYDVAGESIPEPLKSLKVGNRLELCGEPFPGGLHWVHSNCGIKPTKTTPNGWVKLLNSSGKAGANLEGSQEYCYLWN